MQYRNLILILLTFFLIVNAASTPSSDIGLPQDAEVLPPPEVDFDIGQNSSHVTWGYTHNGEMVNFTENDELRVFPANTSGNSSQPDNETDEDEGNEGGQPDDSVGHDSDDGEGTYGNDPVVEDTENSSTVDNQSENGSNTENSSPENGKNKDDNENLLPTTFPEAKDKGLYQNITGQFTKSSGMLAAVFLAFGGLGAYIYRF